MDLGLNGKRALVLGSSQGIGAEIARVLAREGCNVYVGARRLDHIQSLADELSEEFNVDVKAYPIDLSDGISVEKLCEMITHEWKIDILLNNAGGPLLPVAPGFQMKSGRAVSKVFSCQLYGSPKQP